MAGDCCGFKFLRRSVDGKHLMHFQSKIPFSNFSGLVGTTTHKNNDDDNAKDNVDKKIEFIFKLRISQEVIFIQFNLSITVRATPN